MKTSAASVIVFALKRELRALNAGGVRQAFGGEDSMALLLDTLGAIGVTVDIVTDCPAEMRERWQLAGSVRGLSLGLHTMRSGGVSAAVMGLTGIARGSEALLVLDAAAPLVEGKTLRALLAQLRSFSVAVSETRSAVALRRDVLTAAVEAARGVRLQSLADWCGAMAKDAALATKSKRVAGAQTYEGALRDIAHVYAAVAARRLQRVIGLVTRGLGVTDPASLDLRGTLKFGRNVTIAANVQVLGEVVLGDDVTVGPNCLLENVRVGAGSTIKEFTTLSGARIGPQCRLGPYARVRPGSKLGAACQIGNFVEIKASRLGRGCKINHHAFVGDATLADDVIIGAGSITCNYDGAKTQRTRIGRAAFVGSGVMMIAPITIGRGAFVAAGSTVTKRAPAGGLTITRAKQAFVPNWRK